MGNHLEEIKQAKQVCWLVFGKMKQREALHIYTKARAITFVRL